jgi:hypothetical protein
MEIGYEENEKLCLAMLNPQFSARAKKTDFHKESASSSIPFSCWEE